MRYAGRLTCCALLVLCSGCGPTRTTEGVRGEVSFDGRPLETGTIDFIPVEGTAGGSARSVIANGRYEVAAEHGLLANGTYQVRVIGLRKTGRKEFNRLRAR